MKFRRSMVYKSMVRIAMPLAMLLMIAPSGAFADIIPAGSHATVRLNTSLSSATAHKEQPWSGTLTSDIVSNGKVVAKAGAPVKGKVTYVNRSGRLHKPGALSLRLTSINGETVYSSLERSDKNAESRAALRDSLKRSSYCKTHRGRFNLFCNPMLGSGSLIKPEPFSGALSSPTFVRL